MIGEVERVTFENEGTGFRVIRVGSLQGEAGALGSISVVGTFAPVGPGVQVRVTGRLVTDERHGQQFRAQSLVALVPESAEGLERYLASGIIPGVGPGLARRIVGQFGDDTLRVLDHESARLGAVKGISQKRALEIGRSWAAQRETSNLMLLLQTHGASPAIAVRIFKHFGDGAAQVVQGAPYRLALQVPGVGFKTADQLARSLGIRGDHPERAQAGVLHELDAFSDQGHTSVPREILVARAQAMLEVDEAHVQAAIDALEGQGKLRVEEGTVSLSRLYQAEHAIAVQIARRLGSEPSPLRKLEELLVRCEEGLGVRLEAAQREAVALVANNQLSIITGGPGVGKTTTIRAVLALLMAAGLQVRLAAPTGRAAKRLAEATGHLATTLHRLLEFDPHRSEFQRNQQNPIEAQAVIVDEASMIDVMLGKSLLDGVSSQARLVFVGDPEQLPSVGPGALLRDLLLVREVPRIHLHRIFRQADASRIVEAAHSILAGEVPASAHISEPNADFFVISRSDAEATSELIVELVSERIPKQFGLDARDDIRVLTPMHRGPVGTFELNLRLQSRLNPSGPGLEVRRQTLRLGDKVMQTRNDYQREVFNGDLGSVVDVEPLAGTLKVEFDGRVVEYAGEELQALTLAYATSIHKSQGSEYPAVVIPLLTSHFVMLSRNLVYTAVTRARRLCVLVADPRALKLALQQTRREERKTRLFSKLSQALATSR
jgi:exodeoxyribonuclease V alpha subunit